MPKIPRGTYRKEEAVKPQGPTGGQSPFPAPRENGTTEVPATGLMELVVSRQNMLRALRRVERNHGAPGIDGVTVEQLRDQIRREWPEIREELHQGTYQPNPVKQVEIPKPSGGVRKLGIPTVMDRLIQQAITQVLTPIFDPGFSEHSYGFRPGRSVRQAVEKAGEYANQGFTVVVDLDLANFFDTVNHDILMAKVAKKMEDKRVLAVIRRYLQAGIMADGVLIDREVGTPQGGPLSPLLSNILLDDLDKELERRGHRFVRYADDQNILVRSKRAGERVFNSIRAYLEKKLRLKVNEAKSAVDYIWRRRFLGFSYYTGKAGIRLRIAPESYRRLKEAIRQATGRSRSMAMAVRIRKLNEKLLGWVGHFWIADARGHLRGLDEWIRRRLRMVRWKEWKRPYTRYKNLRNLGLTERQAWEGASSQKGYWRLAGSPPTQIALNNAYWRSQGLISLEQRYLELRNR